MGFNTLADLQMLGLEYQHTGLAVTRNLIKTQPDLVRNILRGFVEAIYYMKTHRKESLVFSRNISRLMTRMRLRKLTSPSFRL